MKTTQPLHDRITSAQTPTQSNVAHVYKLGLDVDLKNIITAIQCDAGQIKPAQKFSHTQPGLGQRPGRRRARRASPAVLVTPCTRN
jgi:hypothetical protein